MEKDRLILSALRKLSRETGKQIIVTLAQHGAIACKGNTEYSSPVFHVTNIVDTTGAGDAYRAGFVTGYLRGLPLDVCGQMGSVTAAYTVEKYGTQTHHFTKKEFIKRYEANYGKTIML